MNQRDFEFLIKLNKEVVDKLVDTTVIIYKLHQTLTKTNSYGEATSKTWYSGVECPAIIDLADPSPAEALQTVDVDQKCTFAFLRRELEERVVYPEQGDIILYDNQYYEIHQVTETQFVTGRAEMKLSIVVETHLTRNTTLQLEPPLL